MQQQQHPTWVSVVFRRDVGDRDGGRVAERFVPLRRCCFRGFGCAADRVYKCNCSICWMKQNHHFVVPHQKLRLLGNANVENVHDEYTFGTRAAKHYACKRCNICAFYQPRSNPHGFGVTIYCMERYSGNPSQPNRLKVNFHEFDGIHWEQSIQTSSIVAKSECQ